MRLAGRKVLKMTVWLRPSFFLTASEEVYIWSKSWAGKLLLLPKCCGVASWAKWAVKGYNLCRIARGGLLICREVDPCTAPLIGFLIFQAIWQYQTWSLSFATVIAGTVTRQPLCVCVPVCVSKACEGNIEIREECIHWKAMNGKFVQNGCEALLWLNSLPLTP